MKMRGIPSRSPPRAAAGGKRKAGIVTMSRNSEYISRMQAQLKNWDADLQALAAQGNGAGAEANAAFAAHLKQLGTTRDSAHKAFRQIRAASEAASQQMQDGLDTTLKAMQKSLEKVAADLRAHRG
jgi:molecular chaperone GrpE (heat shock protein)